MLFLHFRHNFISLPIGMKNVMMKISALLLSVWYCLSIIGFDLHTCSETGDTFVHISFTSHSCHDIHDDHCDSACAHEHGDHCEEPVEHHHDGRCCEDEYQVISLTGLRSDDDSNGSFHGSGCPCIMETESDTFALLADITDNNYFEEPDSGLILADAQPLLSIWRI